MSDPKMKSSAKKKPVSPLNRIAAVRVVAAATKPTTETVVVVSGDPRQPKVTKVQVEKSLVTTFPSKKSIDFMRRSDEATNGGVRLFGRRHAV